MHERERRKHVRLQADLNVICTSSSGGESAGALVDRKFTPLTRDLCLDGIKLITDHLLPEGSLLDLLIMSQALQAYIEVRGRVAWSNSENDLFHIGVQFIDISEENERLLCELINILDIHDE